MSKCKASQSARQSDDTCKLMDMSGDDEPCGKIERDKEDLCDQENGTEDIRSGKCKTSFSVDDILSPSKFNGQVTNFAPEYFMRWQPWLMQEALRQNCTFPDLALSFYKPFLTSPKNGEFSLYAICVVSEHCVMSMQICTKLIWTRTHLAQVLQ